jgi:hypothetical protein
MPSAKFSMATISLLRGHLVLELPAGVLVHEAMLLRTTYASAVPRREQSPKAVVDWNELLEAIFALFLELARVLG